MISSALMCLALVISHEARGEPEKGMYAVGHVVLNRVDSSSYPDNICDVVYQRAQFSHIRKAKKPTKKAFQVAKDILTMCRKNNLGGRIYFNRSYLGKKYKTRYKVLKIGKHLFY